MQTALDHLNMLGGLPLEKITEENGGEIITDVIQRVLDVVADNKTPKSVNEKKINTKADAIAAVNKLINELYPATSTNSNQATETAKSKTTKQVTPNRSVVKTTNDSVNITIVGGKGGIVRKKVPVDNSKKKNN